MTDFEPRLKASPKTAPTKKLPSYLCAALLPVLVTKSLMLYFGLHYAMYPGKGYGYGLAAAVGLTFGSFAHFIWVNRHETEEE